MWLFQLIFILIVGVFKLLELIIKGIVSIFSNESTTSSSSSQSSSSAASDEDMISVIAKSMTIGAYCALGDGNLDSRELAKLRRWKKDFVSKMKDGIRSEIDRAMENEIDNSIAGVSEERLHKACSNIKDVGDPFKSMTMELSFEIVAADHKVMPSELACLHKIARLLDISSTKFKDLEDKYLRPIQLKAATSGNADASENELLLGIVPTWSKEQKLAQLTSEFAKYNARMQAIRSDEQRAQCRRMLEIIASMREEIITGRKPTTSQNKQPHSSPSPTSRSGPSIPPPIPSKDEVLLNIDPALSPQEKLSKLDEEEVKWKGRLSNKLSDTAQEKCEYAIQAIRRLRNFYKSQI